MSDPETTVRTTGQLNAALAGRYLIEAEIGRGGMATVYRATDLRHHRKVAVKVLRQDIGAALGPERFLSEIEVTANLQHPNLLPLFDSGEVYVPDVAGGAGEARSHLFYVMPYIEGQTLRQRLQREGQLPVDEALRIASSIAGALDYAHRHGVVHRDLKPENVLMHERQPLVMDFGIALAVSQAGAERLTQLGISLGTPQYMSPEQATGDRDVDARTDIYSLGAMLYEMLAGAPPHTGGSVQALIAKVIMDRPASVRATRELVPAHVDAAIARALAKLPADRFTTASEFARALEGEHAVVTHAPAAAREPELRIVRAGPLGALSTVLATRPVVRRAVVGTAWTALLAGAGTVGALAALAWYAEPEAPYQKFPVLIPDSVTITGSGSSVAISPDGRQLALVGAVSGQSSRLLARPMAGVAFTPLHGTEAAASPAFSPDGANLLYVAGGRLWKVASQGGAPLPLADSADGGHSWGDANHVVFSRHGALWRVPSSGGTAQLVAKPDAAHGIRALAWPDVLPGSKHALITLARTAADSSHIGVVSLADGAVTDLGLAGTGARFAAPEHLIYASADGSLWAVPFSASKRAITGAKTLLASGVNVDANGAADVTVSSSGAVIYGAKPESGPASSNRRVSVAIVDKSGAVKQTGAQVGEYFSPRVSPDGARVALTVREAGVRTDVWIYEVATGQLTPMTRDAVSLLPEWADARRIVFREHQTGGPGTYNMQPWDHSAAPQPFLSVAIGGGTGQPAGLSLGPPAGYLAVTMFPWGPRPRQHRQDILIAPMARPNEQRDVVATDASEVSPRISPNGKWLAYTSNESGAFQLYVLPVPGPGPRTPVSIEQGTEPVWSRDGHTLYYLSRGLLLAAHIDESSGFRATRQDTLFNFVEKGFVVLPPPRTNASAMGAYDVFPNGDFAVLAHAAGADSSRGTVIAMMNWKRLLKQGAAAGSKQ